MTVKYASDHLITAMRNENYINFVSLLQNETFLNALEEPDSLANQMDRIEKEFHVKHNDYIF